METQDETTQELRSEGEINPKSHRIVRWLKFLLIPSWRDPEFTKIEQKIAKERSLRKPFGKLLTPLSISGALIITFLIFLAIYVQWLTPYTKYNLTKLIYPGEYKPPSPGHPLGTTQNGWDLLGRILWGTRTALLVSISSTAISAIIGTILGVIAAYSGKKIDSIITRISDFILLFPPLLLALVIIAIFGAKLLYVIFALSFLGFPGYTRLIRSTVLQVKQNLFIKSAKTSGVNNFRVMFRHIFPNAISPLIIAVSTNMGYAILTLSSIGFLGLSDPTLIDWGFDISKAISDSVIFTAPFSALWPGLAIGLATMGFMLLGDGLRDIFDPKQR